METIWFYGSAIIVSILLTFKFLFSERRRSFNIPPYPARPLPIVGHFHILKHLVHIQLQEYAKKLGPVISLRFGNRLVVVVMSASAAEECFTKNDITFANRPDTLVGKYALYNNTSLVASSYGEHWRNLRRLTSEDIVSQSRLKQFQSLRQDEIKRLLQSLNETSNGRFAKVDLRSKLSDLTSNIITRMVAGKRYFGETNNVEEAKKFKILANELFEEAGELNPEDFIPFLRWIDYRGLKKKLIKLGKELDSYFENIVEEHRREKKNTMIGHLLNLQESNPEYYTDEIIKGLTEVVIIAGTDTSTVTMEWAMALLLNHPHVLKKARDEVDLQIAKDRLVTEEDLSKLPYIQAIIYETFRLFPPGPMIIPHMSSEDCTLQGYDIPRGTMLLTNVWAIHRDPKIWEDPTSFKPERFIGKEIDPFALMPFGKGRRACPGSVLAQRLLNLTLASLIQCFEWERTTIEEVNLDGAKGLSMPKVVPLEALCKSRQFICKLLPDSS